jgi:hypothetical protein
MASSKDEAILFLSFFFTHFAVCLPFMAIKSFGWQKL